MNEPALHRCPLRLGLAATVVLFAAASFAQTIPKPSDGDSKTDDESRRRLIRKTQGADEDDVMIQAMRHMQDAQQRLADLLDPGADTQAIQQKILEDLDVAIKQAQQNLRMKKLPAPSKSDPRKEGETSDTDDGHAQEGGADPAAGQPGEADDVEAVKPGELRERQRQWGNLPPRDREELRQGVEDEFNEKYEDLIERYYESLAKPEQP